MKQQINKSWRRLMPLLTYLFMMMTASAFAQDSGNEVSSNSPIDTKATIDTNKVDTPKMENNTTDLLSEILQPDTSNRTERTGKEGSCGLNEGMSETPRSNNNCE